MKPSCFYLSLIQAAASRVKGNNDLSSESRCLRASVGAGMYLLYSQIGDTIFSNFICSPSCLLGAGGRAQRYQRERYLERVFSLALYSFVLFFSVFRSYIPREILCVIAIQPSALGFHLTIASDYFPTCAGRSWWKTSIGGLKKYSPMGKNISTCKFELVLANSGSLLIHYCPLLIHYRVINWLMKKIQKITHITHFLLFIYFYMSEFIPFCS